MAGISDISSFQSFYTPNLTEYRNLSPATPSLPKVMESRREDTQFSSYFSRVLDESKHKQDLRMREIKEKLRDLMKTSKEEQNPFAAGLNEKANGYMELSEAEEDEKPHKSGNGYNYKEVASKIRQAKTSQSAGQALLSAKRKVLEVRRKISTGDGDPEELQMALTHARRMEMVARKKKHHLELEEMAVTTQKRDERADKQEEMLNGMKDSLIAAEEEKIYEKEGEIFDKRLEMLKDALEEFKESGKEVSDEMISELNETISEFGEDILKELEDAMEMLESIEIIDPHMSKEELEELKRKHRASENKAIAKADMDYLKDMIKHQAEIGKTDLNMSSGQAGSFSFAGFTGGMGSAGSEIPIPEGFAIDVSV